MMLNLLHLSIFVNKNKFTINVFVRNTYSVCINDVKEKMLTNESSRSNKTNIIPRDVISVRNPGSGTNLRDEADI